MQTYISVYSFFSLLLSLGVITTTQFDHLVTESVRKGFYGAVKPAAPSNSLLVTTGCNPYVGYYHASEVRLTWFQKCLKECAFHYLIIMIPNVL